MLIGGGAGRGEFHVPQIQCQHIMIECFPVINWKNLVRENGSKSLGIREVIRYLASNALELGEELQSPKKRKGTRRKCMSFPQPCKFSALSPVPATLCLSAHSHSSGKKACMAKIRERGFSGPKPASSSPPSLYLSKPQACLIMINCHMDNQIQFQKVGNDTPRTPGKMQGMPLFERRNGRSFPQPRNLFLF